jgi:hypothetical protein
MFWQGALPRKFTNFKMQNEECHYYDTTNKSDLEWTYFEIGHALEGLIWDLTTRLLDLRFNQNKKNLALTLTEGSMDFKRKVKTKNIVMFKS